MLLEPMNKVFPRLEDLSLTSTDFEGTNLMLPETLQAPDLRRLTLHGVSLPTRLPLLSSAITLSILSLTDIRASGYFPPGHLVAQLQSLPHLEELSIGFAVAIPIPSSKGELLPAPVSPVTLPSLRRLTFRGVDDYIDNLVAQINTPRLARLRLTLFFDLAFTLVNLTDFILRTEGFRRLVAKVIFDKDGASICYEQQGIGELSLRVNCKPLGWRIDSATQVCSALGKVVSAVEELTLDLDVDAMSSDREITLESLVWHELLLPFVGVEKLCIGSLLARELSQALESVTGRLVLELLPNLRRLEVPLKYDKLLSKFIKTRESVGRPVPLLAPPISYVDPL
jgi:hypothetical protein